MAITVSQGLDRGAPVDVADLIKKVTLGTMLSNLCTPITETVAVSSHVGTLAYLPSSIECVYVTAGTVSGMFDIIPSGVSPAEGEVAVNYATGALTFKAADAVTEASVVYHKCAEKALLAASWIDVR
jgi:hypothetical protein